jgi:hypothetical protein
MIIEKQAHRLRTAVEPASWDADSDARFRGMVDENFAIME